jgi:ACR3 family arsenite efflux pump ArsB
MSSGENWGVALSILLAAFGAALTAVSGTVFELVLLFMLIFGVAVLYGWLVWRKAQAGKAGE